MGSGGSNGGGEKWTNARCILKEEPIGFLPGLTGSETAIQRRSSQVAHTHRSLSRAEEGVEVAGRSLGLGRCLGGGEGRMGRRILLQQVTNQPQAAGR